MICRCTNSYNASPSATSGNSFKPNINAFLGALVCHSPAFAVGIFKAVYSEILKMDCGESSTVISNPKPISIREAGKLYLYRLRICSCLELMQFFVRSFWFQHAPTDGLCWFETLFRENEKSDITRFF